MELYQSQKAQIEQLTKFRDSLNEEETSLDAILPIYNGDLQKLVIEYKNALNPINKKLAKPKTLSSSSDPKQSRVKALLTKTKINPTVFCLFQSLAKNILENEEKIKVLQGELNQSKFTQDSQNGKRLMNRIRLLEQENEELRKSNSQTSKRLKTEQEIALRKKLAFKFLHTNEKLLRILTAYENEAEKFTEMIRTLSERRRQQTEEIEALSKEADPEFLRQIIPEVVPMEASFETDNPQNEELVDFEGSPESSPRASCSQNPLVEEADEFELINGPDGPEQLDYEDDFAE